MKKTSIFCPNKLFRSNSPTENEANNEMPHDKCHWLRGFGTGITLLLLLSLDKLRSLQCCSIPSDGSKVRKTI